MANIYGVPGEEYGDKKLYKVLETLPSDWVIYVQPTLVYKDKRRSADYVLINRELGLIELEVKDWVRIEDRTADQAYVNRKATGKSEWEDSPVKQAKGIAEVASNILRENPELLRYANGKLDFPYRYAGVLPNIKKPAITWLEKAWGEGYIFGEEDITRENILKSLKRIPAPFNRPMTLQQFDVVRAMLDDRLIARDHNTKSFKGIYSLLQEEIAKEPLAVESKGEAKAVDAVDKQKGFLSFLFPGSKERIEHLEQEVPEENREIKSLKNVKLVRGYAGTGKTDILVLRAAYLHQNHPEMDLLVTTFNRPVLDERLIPELKEFKRIDVFGYSELCEAIYKKKHGKTISPQHSLGLIKKLQNSNNPIAELINKYGDKFISDEIQWIKEVGYTKRALYISNQRDGRGKVSGRMLTAKMKEEVFDIFERYQEELTDILTIDWTDLHEKALKYINQGFTPDKKYDVVLIDEAQHFAPSWIKTMQGFIKDGGSLFLCDDPSQSVYRVFSWEQKGIKVRGRTRWLKIPYRTTRQIFDAAFALIESNPLSQQMLSESGTIEKPNLEDPRLRQGEKPHFYKIPTLEEEIEFVGKMCNNLITSGLLPGEIAILHTKKHVIEKYKANLLQGIKIDDLTRRTGMEYKAVFIPQLQHLFDRNIDISWEENIAKNQQMFYMAITRARDWFYICGNEKFPKELEPILLKITVHDHI